MRGNHGAVVTKNSYGLTGVTWSFIFMMVFCFAGCAAGSCLSYGHSCWGAHGKRSGGNFGTNNLRVGEDNNKNIVFPSVNDHWMLSPLINKRHQIPSSGKYRVRWINIFKGRGLPRDWDNSESIVSKEDNDITREENERFLKNKESGEESKEESVLHDSTEPFDDDSEEIILLPRHRETNDNSKQFRFMKIMRNADANLK